MQNRRFDLLFCIKTPDMKNLIIPLFTLFFSISVFSQSEIDYKNSLDFFSTSFNEQKTSLIYERFSLKLKEEHQEEVFKKMINDLYKEKGKTSHYEFLMEEKNEKNYLIDFENGSMLLIFFLSPDNKISAFKITEY